MKKSLLVLLFMLTGIAQSMWAQVPIDGTHFPDEDLQDYLRYYCDSNQDGILSADEIAQITGLPMWDTTSLQGLEYLTSLVGLRLVRPKLAVINLQNVPQLTVLNIENCDMLTELDISNNTALKSLSLNYRYDYHPSTNMPLSSLDLSHNTALEELRLGWCSFSSIDLSLNSSLESLEMRSCAFTSLNLSSNTMLKYLTFIENENLSELIIESCTALEEIGIYSNPLSTLDVKGKVALRYVNCYNNQIEELDLTGCSALSYLRCVNNKQLTTINITECTALETIECYGNQINETSMGDLVNSLPYNTSYCWIVPIDTSDESEQNVINTVQVRTAKEKGWRVYDNHGGDLIIYGGTAPTNGDSDMEPIEVECTIVFTDGNLQNIVIDNIYYNLKGDDGYDSTNQCIVINTPTSNEPSGVPGVDTDFSGIIFQVNGQGVIELDCQTLGVNVLNVKVGSQDPTTISKNERGIIEVAYDVTEPTYVYVYATSARAGAPLRVSASENCVKLWSLTVKPGATLGISHTTATTPIGEEMYYTLDGRKVVNPTKGVYIYKGKKLVIK